MSGKTMPLSEDRGARPSSSTLMDHFLFEALQGTKDRLFILKTEYQIEKFMRNQSETQMSFPELNSYHRLMVHRVAQYFQLIHLPDTTKTGVLLYKSAASHVPALKLSDFIETEDAPEAAKPPARLKIMKRNAGLPVTGDSTELACVAAVPAGGHGASGSRSGSLFFGSSGGSQDATAPRAASDFALVDGESGPVSGRKEYKSMEEREADYLKARARIFGDFDESKSAIAATTSASAALGSSARPAAASLLSSSTLAHDSLARPVEYLTVTQLAMHSDPDARLAAESLIQEDLSQPPSPESASPGQRPTPHFYSSYYSSGAKPAWQPSWALPSSQPPPLLPYYQPLHPGHASYHHHYRPGSLAAYYPYADPHRPPIPQSPFTHFFSSDWPSLSSNVRHAEPPKSSNSSIGSSSNGAEMTHHLARLSIASSSSESDSQPSPATAELTCLHILEVGLPGSEVGSISSTIESLLSVHKSHVKRSFVCSPSTAPSSSSSAPPLSADGARTLVVVFKSAKSAERAKTEWGQAGKSVAFWRRAPLTEGPESHGSALLHHTSK